MTKIEGAVVNAVGQLTGAVSSRSLTGLVASGGMIVNDWQITMEEIEGGHRLTAKRGTEVQTMDIMDGEPGEVPQKQIEAAVSKYLEENPVDGGVSFVTDKTLSLKDGVLSVNTTDEAKEADPRPITAQGVYNEFAVINALLKTI
ncbi:MAG: hypothetical protein J6L72_06380 [Butyricicoccus sp.]|nr:hypothetical protein [Butyricicoccus sp.]